MVDFPSYDDLKAHLPTLTPSRHAVAGCFLSSYWEKDKLYKKHMQCTSLTERDGWLSCDHTFASAGKTEFACMYAIVQTVAYYVAMCMCLGNPWEYLVRCSSPIPRGSCGCGT